jgi:hypothetical protein
MKKIILSLVALTALAQAAGNIETLTPLVDEVPEVQDTALDKISFGGYGKMDYTNYLDKDGKDKLDMYRFILYVGYQFTENIKLVSEIEWEHGGREETGGYGVVEQAYIDFKVNETLSAKVGHFIVPMGMVNLYHEPTAFNTVSRPETEKYIIPSTWHENGVMLHGKIENISYQAGVIAALNANNGDSIRGMRQSGQKAKAEDFGFVGRVDYKANNFYVGGSFYTGEAGQGAEGVDVSTSLAEIHAGIQMNGFDIHGLYAMNEIDGNNFDEEGTRQDISTSGAGYYVNASYAIDKWTPFVQYEAYTTDDRKDDIIMTTLGLNYNPIDNVVLKADYVKRDNRGTDDNRVELGIGWSF